MVPNKLWNALPCGPFCFLECTPMLSVTNYGVHSDLVLITFENALRSGPPYIMRVLQCICPLAPFEQFSMSKLNFHNVPKYRGGPLRSAFLKVMRTKSECTPKIVTDHMGVHSKKQKGPHGSAFHNLLGTTWDCTPNSERDHIGVHFFK